VPPETAGKANELDLVAEPLLGTEQDAPPVERLAAPHGLRAPGARRRLSSAAEAPLEFAEALGETPLLQQHESEVVVRQPRIGPARDGAAERGRRRALPAEALQTDRLVVVRLVRRVLPSDRLAARRQALRQPPGAQQHRAERAGRTRIERRELGGPAIGTRRSVDVARRVENRAEVVVGRPALRIERERGLDSRPRARQIAERQPRCRQVQVRVARRRIERGALGEHRRRLGELALDREQASEAHPGVERRRLPRHQAPQHVDGGVGLALALERGREGKGRIRVRTIRNHHDVPVSSARAR